MRTKTVSEIRNLDALAVMEANDCIAYIAIAIDPWRSRSEQRGYASLAVSLARKVARYALRESALDLRAR